MHVEECVWQVEAVLACEKPDWDNEADPYARMAPATFVRAEEGGEKLVVRFANDAKTGEQRVLALPKAQVRLARAGAGT